MLPLHFVASISLLAPQTAPAPLETPARPLPVRAGVPGSEHRQENGAVDVRGDAVLAAILERAWDGDGVVGGAAALAVASKPTRVASFGVRRTGDETPFRADDLVHLGSDTKAMTAALCARLVDDGDLAWDSTVAAVLPEIAAEVHEGYREVTLLQLLRHTGGLPEHSEHFGRFEDVELRERRRRIAVLALQDAPANEPGETFRYSNLGYLVAGVMAERVGGATWEELIRKEVFQPLGITSAGFGVPGTEGEVDQPWGHVSLGDALIPVQSDNPEALGPAGTAHMSMADWARFALSFTDAGRVEGFLSDASLARLLEPGPGGYACGWMVQERGWARGVALTHAGSNTMWYAVAWVAPRTGRAYLVALNSAQEEASSLVDEVVGKLIRLDLESAER
ncbi:MAG: serine hydrolase domain-containing protein, partial [Planctomycetota bacterium]